MSHQKRVAAVHDISGFGRCSLTVALPIISAAGIETTVMPTAVLSTHTGGFTGFTYRDLTEDLRPFTAHWRSLNLSFDALYSGFLGSFEQLEMVSEFFDAFKSPDNLVLVDPVMADHGSLYGIFSPAFAKGMAGLCKKADIIVPNMTEAAFLLGESYTEGPYEKSYIEGLLRRLSTLGPRQVVLTGVCFGEDALGAASYDAATDRVSYTLSPRIPGYYHGTGDVFGSALVAALVRDKDLAAATKIAVDFTHGSIQRTKDAGTDIRYGVNFEEGLPGLMRDLDLI